MDDSVKKSRLFVATVALVKHKYPEDLAKVILDDTSLPAWQDALDEADSVIKSLELGSLFTRVAEVDKMIETKNQEVKRANQEVERLNSDIEGQVRDGVRRGIARREDDLMDQIRQLEDELYETEKSVENYMIGVSVKRDIKRYGPIHSVDYDIMDDDEFELDYYSGSFKPRWKGGLA